MYTSIRLCLATVGALYHLLVRRHIPKFNTPLRRVHRGGTAVFVEFALGQFRQFAGGVETCTTSARGNSLEGFVGKQGTFGKNF